jgi:peptide/nickel transport system substrate-binding protein
VARRLIIGVALVAALVPVAGAGGAPEQAPKRGGTLVMGTLVEPACINAFLARCHGSIPPAGLMMNVALRGAFKVGSGFTWQEDLVSGVDFTTQPPFTLTYRIRSEARWSDGVPISARDFVFTHTTLKRLSENDRAGLGLEFVRRVTPLDAKTVRVVLRSRYAGWRALFSRVLPRHALQGADFSTVWLTRVHDPKTGRSIGSGPFLIESWDRGREVTFVRNPRYWGPRRPYLDRIVLRFCRQCGSRPELIERLRTGELDLVMGLGVTAEDVDAFRNVRGVRVLAQPGPLWEHFDIRTKRGGHPALQRKAVRRALAYGIDRAAIVKDIYGSAGAAFRPSQSSAFLEASPSYRPNWSAYRYRPREARRLLEQEGCREGVDGVYVCDGERLSLRFFTTAGRGSPRERTLQLVQGQLGQAGVEVVPVFAPGSVLFNQILPNGEFDVALFNWIQDPNAAALMADLYGCGGDQNYSGYCQRLVTEDLDQAKHILDGARLTQVLNRADAQLAKDVPVIPLVERPLLAAFHTSVRNVTLDTGAWNPFANAEEWWLDD